MLPLRQKRKQPAETDPHHELYHTRFYNNYYEYVHLLNEEMAFYKMNQIGIPELKIAKSEIKN